MDGLAKRYAVVRARTEALCAPLEIEDFVVQSMPDASPARWHLAHTTWFFETFVLRPHAPGHAPRDARFEHLFNSYYQGVGAPFERARRGTQSRPTVAQVMDWRAEVDAAMARLLGDPSAEVARVTTIGLHHEQQHQELLLTDLKHAFCTSPMRPVYRADAAQGEAAPPDLGFEVFEGGVVEVGFDGDGFCFDNERPRHRVFVEPFRLARDLVTQGQFRAFVEDDGYGRCDLWLDDGWTARRAQGWQHPLYWRRVDRHFVVDTLGGERPLDPHAPVTHLSFYEADAYARWAGLRLPTELEWEHAQASAPDAPRGAFQEDDVFHPVGRPVRRSRGLRRLLGEVWEWTQSAYLPYPNYRPLAGTLGEYNGKFMNDQRVLRGGSCATPRDHVRPTYRNFFQGDKRWQFTGLRLAGPAR